MSYQCPLCDYTNKKWSGLRMHMMSHRDEFPDGLPKREDVRFIEDDEREVLGGATIAGKVKEFENEDANKLRELLLLHGVRPVVADTVSNLFDKLDLYREPYNLSNLLKNKLTKQEQIAIIPILMELFPDQRGQMSGFMPMSPFESPYYRQPGAFGFPPMSGFPSGLPVNPQLETRLTNIEKVLEKMIDEGDNHPNPELQAQVDALQAQLQDEKEKRQEDREKRRDDQVNQLMNQLQQQNEKMPELITEAYNRSNQEYTMRETARKEGAAEGARTKSQDFEGRLLDIAQEQVAPAVIGEVKQTRTMVQELLKRAGDASKHQGALPGPINDDEASRISEAMLIQEEMRALAAKSKTTGAIKNDNTQEDFPSQEE